jgi:N-acetyl-gamma-glutamyl-phosphate reductase
MSRLRVGLVGLRGHTGAELVRLIGDDHDLALVYAASRQGAGEPARHLVESAPEGLMVSEPDPDDLVCQELDAVILALPNGIAAPFVDVLSQRPDWSVVDLSADYRADPHWCYGLPEITGKSVIRGHRRIANPGCYATAAQLALWPVRHHLTGPAVIHGISGYSGAGTTPSPRNDTARLANSVMPYALTGHNHEAEIARGVGKPVWFTPHVAGFFRGLIVTVNAPVDGARNYGPLYLEAFGDQARITVTEEPVEIADVAGKGGARLGGLRFEAGQSRLAVTAGLDNLLKGAAEQALQNLRLSAGLD